MNLETAIKMLKSDINDAINRFEIHYRDGMKNTDFYPDELSNEEWHEQFEAFLTLEEEYNG